MTRRYRLRVTGLVQGVGFRPFVHELAGRCGLSGFVRNDATGVTIEVEGSAGAVDRFGRLLRGGGPPLARIDHVESCEIEPCGPSAFRIATSGPCSDRSAAIVPPDTAVCGDCLRELFDPTDRRYRHPFITCTNCGPRFTIITALPYDRPNTTMASFVRCPACDVEYADPTDRRHHAQPIACHQCGPQLEYRRGAVSVTGTEPALAAALADLAGGRIVAVKGLGGFHLAADATCDAAVRRLRERKNRVDKPFAVMVPDLDAARELAHLTDDEARTLSGPAHPIVLTRARRDSPVSAFVAPGNPLLGILLPYTPVHHLLFAPRGGSGSAPGPIVMTSGNLTNEPICHDDAVAQVRLGPLADGILGHDRRIHTPVDDSVVRITDGCEMPIRRSRGYAPLPVQLPVQCLPTLAVGGEIKNTCALATGDMAYLSQHLGDMSDIATHEALEASAESLERLYGVAPDRIAVDTHPGYHTRRWGHERARRLGMPEPVEVQHHHAHLAALLAEHGHDGPCPAIGFVFDGTGYGTDGTLWGGEVLIGDYQRCERWGHLVQVPLPGGESAARNPCRSALAHLRAAGIEWSGDLRPVKACSDTELQVLREQLARSFNCVSSSSMGRLFDAVASLLGTRHRITYEAQAAIELEILAGTHDGPPVTLAFELGPDGRIDAGPLLRALTDSIRRGEDAAALARAFHEAVVDTVVECADRIRAERAIEVVGLSGGVFQNALLTELATSRLRGRGFEVLTHRLVPPNDGGLALGQAIVAAHALPPALVPASRPTEEVRTCV